MPLSTGNADFRLYVLLRARSEGKGARPHIRVSGKRKQCAERHGGHVACCSQRLKPRMVGASRAEGRGNSALAAGVPRLVAVVLKAPERGAFAEGTCWASPAAGSVRPGHSGEGLAPPTCRSGTPTATSRGIDARPVWLSSRRRTARARQNPELTREAASLIRQICARAAASGKRPPARQEPACAFSNGRACSA